MRKMPPLRNKKKNKRKNPPGPDQAWNHKNRAGLASDGGPAWKHWGSEKGSRRPLGFAACFEGKNYEEVGPRHWAWAADTARMTRWNRALEKLHRFFTKRGISSTTAIIAGEISANSRAGRAGGFGQGRDGQRGSQRRCGQRLNLNPHQGALKIMAWTKAKMTIAVGGGRAGSQREQRRWW